MSAQAEPPRGTSPGRHPQRTPRDRSILGRPSPMTASPVPPASCSGEDETYAGRAAESVAPWEPAFHYSPAWPIWRRVARTGPNNPNARTGHYTRYRRYQLELPLATAMATFRNSLALLRRLASLPAPARAEASALLGTITGDNHPDRWAFCHRGGGWYVPRAAWPFCAAWLRRARRVQRLIFMAPSMIAAMIPPLLRRGSKEEQPRANRSAHDEIRRLRDACEARGLAWETGRPTA